MNLSAFLNESSRMNIVSLLFIIYIYQIRSFPLSFEYTFGKLDLIGLNLRPGSHEKAVRGIVALVRARIYNEATDRISYDTGPTNREPSRRLALLNIRAARTRDVCAYFRSRTHARMSNRREVTSRARALHNSTCLIHVVLAAGFKKSKSSGGAGEGEGIFESEIIFHTNFSFR